MITYKIALVIFMIWCMFWFLQAIVGLATKVTETKLGIFVYALAAFIQCFGFALALSQLMKGN